MSILEMLYNRAYNSGGCTCTECVEMCKTYACLPTPGQAKALIQGGYGPRMMMDTRPSISEPKILVLTLMPAMVGFEGLISPTEIGISPCSFLKNDLCELHDLELKPLEGVYCRHDTTRLEEQALMGFLKTEWNKPDGQAIVDYWVDHFFRGDKREGRVSVMELQEQRNVI